MIYLSRNKYIDTTSILRGAATYELRSPINRTLEKQMSKSKTRKDLLLIYFVGRNCHLGVDTAIRSALINKKWDG
jgi:hypothetical protein